MSKAATNAQTAHDDGFDFGTIETKHEHEMTVKNPQTGDPTSAVITVAGPEHPRHKALTFAAQRAARKRFSKSGRIEMDDPEEEEATALDKAVACTLAWSGVKRDGKPLECTPANVRELYESAPWLRRQVLAFINTDDNFIVAAAKP